MFWRALAVAAVLCGLLTNSPASAERRVALVIGNGAYKNVPVLPNPGNDAADMTSSLKRLGFDVTTVSDANYDGMRRALLAFGRVARGADIATVFFAGHGMEIGGENWLLPVDAEMRSDTDVEGEAINLRMAMLQVAGASKLGLVILDACRNNPFAAKMQRSIRTRSVERGLARVEPTDNVLVAYASRDGTTANDGGGRNSPFTTALLKHIETPGLEVRFLFANVRDDVIAATRRDQQPYVYGSLSRNEIYLKAPAAAAVSVPPQLAPSPQPAAPSAGERAWSEAKDSTNPAVLEAFIRRFGDTFHGDMARLRLNELKQLAAVPPAPATHPPMTGTAPAIGAPSTTSETARAEFQESERAGCERRCSSDSACRTYHFDAASLRCEHRDYRGIPLGASLAAVAPQRQSDPPARPQTTAPAIVVPPVAAVVPSQSHGLSFDPDAYAAEPSVCDRRCSGDSKCRTSQYDPSAQRCLFRDYLGNLLTNLPPASITPAAARSPLGLDTAASPADCELRCSRDSSCRTARFDAASRRCEFRDYRGALLNAAPVAAPTHDGSYRSRNYTYVSSANDCELICRSYSACKVYSYDAPSKACHYESGP